MAYDRAQASAQAPARKCRLIKQGKIDHRGMRRVFLPQEQKNEHDRETPTEPRSAGEVGPQAET